MKATPTKAKPKSKSEDLDLEVGSESDENSVVQILHKDHQKVAEMFFQFTQLDDDDEKEALVKNIIKELGVHAKVEEELVYPALRKADKENEDMIDEADTEHHVVKFLIAELSGMSADDDHYDSKVTVLCELVKHHVQEEEKEIFEKLEEAELDLEALGEKVLKRKGELSQSPPSPKDIASNSKPGSKKK